MNYKAINSAIINSEDIPISVHKDRKLYRYLLDNNTAYYYSKYLSRQKKKHEKDLIEAGNRLNLKYLKTLKTIIEVCKEGKMEFILFKTFKHVSEVVDGDIDIFIKEKDFFNFLNLMTKKGFVCKEDSKLKASCEKPGLSTVEPRVSISFLGKIIIGDEVIWKNTEEVLINDLRLKRTTKELDMFFMLLNMLYGPNYFKLYSYLVFRKLDPKKIYDLAESSIISEDLKLLINNLLIVDVIGKRFPLFPKDIDFIKWWAERVLNSKTTPYKKMKHILFFFYVKYGYKVFNNLPFRHDWNLKYV